MGWGDPKDQTFEYQNHPVSGQIEFQNLNGLTIYFQDDLPEQLYVV
jgi:hypothetical protein